MTELAEAPASETTDPVTADPPTLPIDPEQARATAEGMPEPVAEPAAAETAPGPEAAAGAADTGMTPAPEPVKKPGCKKKGPPVEIEIPARLLNVVGVAGKEDTRYQMSGVLVETRDVEGLVSAAATDGRRLIVAECNRGLFDGMAVVYIPRAVILSAVRIAIARPQDDKSGAMVTIQRHGDDCHLTAHADYGPAVFEWQMDSEQIFPPYRDVIPDFADSVGAGRIGITSELVSGTLRTLQRVVGKDPKVKVYLPPSADRPIGLESQDGDSIKALAIVMPASIGDWADKPAVKGEEKNADPNQQTLPVGDSPTPADDQSWRSVRLDTLTPKIKPGKLAKLAEAGIETVGQVQDFSGEHGEWWTKRISGFGDSGHKQIGDAIEAFWAARQKAQASQADAPQKLPGADELRSLNSHPVVNVDLTNGDDFAEDAQVPDTLKPICDVKNHLAINVVQYTSGRWRSDYWVSVGGLDESRKLADGPTFANRSEAAQNAIDAVRAALGKVRGEMKGATEKVAQKIVWALESGEESLKHEPTKARKQSA